MLSLVNNYYTFYQILLQRIRSCVSGVKILRKRLNYVRIYLEEKEVFIMQNHNSIFKPIRTRIITIGISLLFILVCFILLHNQSNHKNFNDKIIINVFGKQRMLSQQMSKDANRIYSNMLSLELGNDYESNKTLVQEISNIKDNLILSKKQFKETLKAMHEGHLHYGKSNMEIEYSLEQANDDLAEIDKIWVDFEQALDVIIKAQASSKEVSKALNYINDNNNRLLEFSDHISNIILEQSMERIEKYELLFYGLMFLFIIVCVSALFNLFKYIILPFQYLLNGIHKIGLAKSQVDLFPMKKEVTPAVVEINHMFHKIDNLISLIENINNNSSFMETLDFINSTFSEYVPYNYIGIALIDKDNKTLNAAYGIPNGKGIDIPDNLIGSKVSLKDTSLGQLIETGEVRIINDLEEYTRSKPLTLYNKTILEAGIRASITLPLKVSGEPVGVIFFSSHKKNAYNEEHVNFLRTLVNSIAISLNQNIFINDLLYSDIIALAKLAEARDEDTGEHLERMKKYSRAIAELLFANNMYRDVITPEFIERIERFSPLHDIGKVGISDRILLKPGKLTEEEFDEMKHHTSYGAKVLRAAEENLRKTGKSLFGLGIEISECHHEKWDGSGYPKGLKGQEIPLSARIVAIADVLDALTSKRPYKKPFPFDESIQIIADGSGKHFDPDIVQLVLDNQSKLRFIYKRYNKDRLDEGEI